jgi:soluble lytic murein transglycosylase-like protein
MFNCVAPLFIATVLLAGIGTAQAQEAENCFHTASVKYQLDPWLLVAIARVESTMQPDAHRKYDDGSEDIGLMQINSIWLPALARHGIERADLFHHCTSIHVAAWILATQLYRYGKSWHTVGRYHSTTPAKNAAWVARVASRLRAEHPNFARLNQALMPAAKPLVPTTSASASPKLTNSPASIPTGATPAAAAPVSHAPAVKPTPA